MNKTLKLFLLISFFYSAAPAPDAANPLIPINIFTSLKFNIKNPVTEESLQQTRRALQFAERLPEVARKVRGRVFIVVNNTFDYTIEFSQLDNMTATQINEFIKTVHSRYQRNFQGSPLTREKLDTSLFLNQIETWNFLHSPELYLKGINFFDSLIINIAKQSYKLSSNGPDSKIFREFLNLAIDTINEEDDREKNLIIHDKDFRENYKQNLWQLFVSNKQGVAQELAHELKNFKNSIVITTINFCRNPENFIESDFFSEIVISIALNNRTEEVRLKTPDSQVFAEFANYVKREIAKMEEEGQDMAIYARQFENDSSECTYNPGLKELQQTLWMCFISSNDNIEQRLADELKVLESKGLND